MSEKLMKTVQEAITCRRSSKSLAASFFISETFVVNDQMMLNLKDGIWWKLFRMTFNQGKQERKIFTDYPVPVPIVHQKLLHKVFV